MTPTQPGPSNVRLTTFQIGAPPRLLDGLRIGTTRRPPRGVPRSHWQRDGYFDVWYPLVAPSVELLTKIRPAALADPVVRRRFFAAYRRELQRPPAKYAVELLAAMAVRMPIAIGCFCEDEQRCHRSVLRDEILHAIRRDRRSMASAKARHAAL